ncbi:prolyl oligopeptidase family serine peptidase [Paraburkholderia acidiphila]|uniref:Prolyl oligopeptidase family serine peptidase n=1 Tax=Paraburkholderia acidiphila TaxID=2571747 RepID=A0A7Z2G420_9BURK|nr:prolyl oligopeptidase family serine peptidase [Paraburkholderia acidiphila]QGZ54424.1 prolyl oligopeptidase family serine peptidase [Paraburkholderia acidiphila]
MPVTSPWPAEADPFLSLQSLDDPAVMAWVESQNARTRAAWQGGARFEALEKRLAQAYLPRERPVIPSRWQEWAYDLWEDEDNPKGLWRRALWADWRAHKPQWQTLIDFDALGAKEGMPWVCAGIDILYPDGDRALIQLSDGGSDAVIVREFDIVKREFVDDGFAIAKEGKHIISWIDRDTVYLGWDAGGKSGKKMLTRSGYPREVRRWARGTALADAPVVFSGDFDDISVEGDYDPVEKRHDVVRSVDFFDSYTYRLNERGDWQVYDVPTHVSVGAWHGWLLLEPRLDWTVAGMTYKGGALLVIREDAFLAGDRTFTALFTPTPVTSACDWTNTLNALIVSWLDDVESRTMLWQPRQENGAWRWESRVFPTRASSQVDVSPIEDTLNDEVFVDVDDYLLPPEYWLADLAQADLQQWELLDRWPTQFDSGPLTVIRSHARSADGTSVPFTVIGPKAVLEGDSRKASPCLLTGYGGFAIALTPQYLVGSGIGWLEQGGVVAIAHIRGGGEYGTAWHVEAQREHRQRSFDDFIAVAEKLIADGYSSAAQLGIKGGSNGGLLVGACMVQRPELFGAVVCEVPLLDMQRYPLLHAGASWIDEYGDPEDAEESRALAAYSPYHHVKPGVAYPPSLFTTSTSDDRVHPSHARKMVARMEKQGHANVWYLENTEGGHGPGSDSLERAEYDALVYRFLWTTLAGSW